MAGSDSESEDLLASVFDLSHGAAEVADQVDSPDGGGDSSNALVPISGQGAALAVPENSGLSQEADEATPTAKVACWLPGSPWRGSR